MSTYASSITFIGNVLGVALQAQKLMTYYNTAMSYVANITSKIPVSQRVSVSMRGNKRTNTILQARCTLTSLQLAEAPMLHKSSFYRATEWLA